MFDNDRLQGMLALSATAAANGNGPLQTLTIANVLTVDATQTVALRAPGGSAVTTAVSSLGFAALSGGVLLAGDPGSASVATIQATAVSLLLTNTLGLDVVGLTAVSGMSANMVNNLATTTVGPGGKLTIGDNVRSGGSFRVYSGSIDLSQNTVQQAAAYPIQMDDNNASLIIRSGQSVGVRGFRAGDTIDVKGVAATTTSTVGATAGTTTLTVGGSTISLLGPVQADATYTTASDGNGGTLITTNTNPLAAVSFLDSSVSAAAGGTHALDRIAPSDGGPSYLEWRYIDSGPDSVAISSSTPNSFLRGGSGQKALSASGGGRNVLDGGSGSSFLSGGAGNDTFFVDITSNTPVADTIRNFHAGDAVTVFGYTAANSYTVDASGGAVGSTGGTVRILSAAGGVAATVTFTGFTAAQVSSLNVIADATSGSRPYLYFNNQGV